MSSCWDGAVDGETGLREGRGTYIYPNGFFIYTGNYEHGVKQGTSAAADRPIGCGARGSFRRPFP